MQNIARHAAGEIAAQFIGVDSRYDLAATGGNLINRLSMLDNLSIKNDEVQHISRRIRKGVERISGGVEAVAARFDFSGDFQPLSDSR